MFLLFSVARSQENGSWERAVETAQGEKAVAKTASKQNAFGMNMPMMCSAFDTAMWRNAA
jgi:hypothetical protein